LTSCRYNTDSLLLERVRRRASTIGNSYVHLSLIKSVAGQIPTNEFFDLRFKFATGDETDLFTTANIDIALSQSLNDTLVNRRLTDAGLMLNGRIGKPTSSGESFPDADGQPSDDPKYRILNRMTAVGIGLKVFNTVPYAVIGVSGHELKGSPLEGSYVTVAGAMRAFKDPKIPFGEEPTDLTRPRAKFNLYLEFFVRVPGVQFLDKLRVRGGILFPLAEDFPIESRIVLSVPIVDLTRF